MSAERLQKVLSRAGVASRRRGEELIRAGRVTVNGRVAQIGESADPEADAIKVDGKLVRPPETHTYLLLNKPRGYITTRRDPQGRPTVYDLLQPRHAARVRSVGRLDYQSEGLLLLTDDGDLAHRVAHPRYGCRKTYLVKVRGEPEPEALDRLRQGIRLDGRRTAPAKIVASRRAGNRRPATNSSWWQVEIGEGRTRQIREMFFRVGHPVQKLRRIAVGPLVDRRLGPGDYRELTPGEVRSLGAAVASPAKGGGGGKGGGGRPGKKGT